jgi:hypothetical protein
MVIVAFAVFTGRTVLEAVAVAVMVTVPAGIVAGAVNWIADPLLECPFRLKVPHGGFVQVTVQSTPAAAMSLVTVAVRLVGVPATMGVGKAGVNAIEIAGTIVIVADALFVASADDVAVTVTVPPAGSDDGAVKVAAAPLAVCELTDPHADDPQDTVQLTPRLAGS